LIEMISIKIRSYLLLSSVLLWAMVLTACLDEGSQSSSSVAADSGCTISQTLGQDPLANAAWHLKNTGSNQVVSAMNNGSAQVGIDANVECVHQGGYGITGKGVKVAVVDSGLEIAHEDLSDNVMLGQSFNFTNYASDPSPSASTTDFDHGTSVAGLIAAKGWNAKGARGIAPQASLVGYNYLASGLGWHEYLSLGGYQYADSTDRANIPVYGAFGDRASDVAVFNMSYGGFPLFFFNTADFANPAVLKNQASGRQGLGSIYIKSAGNTRLEGDALYPDGNLSSINCQASVPGMTLCGNANAYAGAYLHSNIYDVAAVSNTGKYSSYSTPGANLWVSGLGGEDGITQAAMVTTDRTGCAAGFNKDWGSLRFYLSGLIADLLKLVADSLGVGTIDPDCNYTGQMNGTSSAAPTVAGVVSLMLEANPKLTNQDVGYILAKTARPIDTTRTQEFHSKSLSDFYGLKTPYVAVDPWIKNAAGFSFHTDYGFGLVDAKAAVNLAKNYVSPSSRRAASMQAFLSSNVTSSVDSETSAKIYQTTVNLGSNQDTHGILWLKLRLLNKGANTVNPGTLQIEIISPSGTKAIAYPAFTALILPALLVNTDFGVPLNGFQDIALQINALYGEKGGTYQIRILDLNAYSTLSIGVDSANSYLLGYGW
jgi:subtilisin family serine protease